MLDQILDHDSKCWKIERFVKDPEDIPRIFELVRKYLPQLKDAFIQVIARSQFPGATKIDFFSYFARKSGLCSDSESALSDRTFIAVKNNPVEMKGKDPTTISRYEFFEAIVRFAETQFYQTGQE
jgi:hypothetical protein